MFIKLSVFVLLVAVIVKDVSGNPIVNPKLEEDIEEMWKKVNLVKKEILEIDSDAVANKTGSDEITALTDVFEKISQNITDDLVAHFDNVANKARETGTLKYDDPELVAALLLVKHKDTLYDVLKAEIMSSTMDEKAKTAFLEVINKGLKVVFKCVEDFANEIKDHPDVWENTDPNYFWRDDSSEETRPEPANEETKAAYIRMDNIINECKTNVLGVMLDFLSVVIDQIPDSITEASTNTAAEKSSEENVI